MKLYNTEEELNLLRVAITVLQKNDFHRLSDAALNVLQKNPDNATANMLYNLDLRTQSGINGITFYSFNNYEIDEWLNGIIEDPPHDDKDSLRLIIDVTHAFIFFCSYAADETAALSTLNLIFECFYALNPSTVTKTSFYKFVTNTFCGANSQSETVFGEQNPLRNLVLSKSTDFKSLLYAIRNYINNDNDISADIKQSLTAQINNSAPMAQPINQKAESSQSGRKLLYIGLGILAVALFVIIYLTCF